ncbi:MAG: alpha/beta hydrolase [Halieaceae bacterium]
MWRSLYIYLFRKFYRLLSALAWRGEVEPDAFSVLQLPTHAGILTARMYSQAGGENRPLILYFHGGGWVIGDLDTHHPFCQALARATSCTVISVDYRLAPEHPFPAAHDDALAATQWVAEHINTLGPSNGRLVVAGDSAGANLATCTCLQLDGASRSRIAGQLVLYPATDHYSVHYPSYTERANASALTTKRLYFFWDTYLGGDNRRAVSAERALPSRAANLSSLPPMLLVTAELDPLRDEGIDYGKKCRAAGVQVTDHHFDNAKHGFACSEGPTPDFDTLMNNMRDWLATL